MLDLTHKMVELLTGERSVDATKDVREEEDPWAVRSSSDGPDVTSRFPGDVTSEKQSPRNVTVRLRSCNDGGGSAERTQVGVKIEPDANGEDCEERSSLNIKEEPWSGDEAAGSAAPADNLQRTSGKIKEESFWSEEEFAASNVKEEEILRDAGVYGTVEPDASGQERRGEADYGGKQNVSKMVEPGAGVAHRDCSECSPTDLVKTRPCPRCGKSFCCDPVLARHQAAHTEEEAFTDKRAPPKPPIVVGQKIQEPLVCSECGQRFAFRSKLVRHRTKHSGEKPFSCPECGKSYGCNAAFLAHRKLHAGEVSHSCPVCGKSFPQRNNLQRHLAVHSGEKPHSCPECGKRFMSKSNLTQHLSVHLPKKKETFCCPECGKCYKRGADFRWHMLIHLGEK